MGYDKPDLGFVVHFQAPGSPVAYYQQVGSPAGHSTRRWPCCCAEPGAQIQDWFIQQAFLDERHVDEVLAVFDDARGPVTLGGWRRASTCDIRHWSRCSSS
jgi:ATP-dependent DNA helicase RecQ